MKRLRKGLTGAKMNNDHIEEQALILAREQCLDLPEYSNSQAFKTITEYVRNCKKPPSIKLPVNKCRSSAQDAMRQFINHHKRLNELGCEFKELEKKYFRLVGNPKPARKRRYYHDRR